MKRAIAVFFVLLLTVPVAGAAQQTATNSPVPTPTSSNATENVSDARADTGPFDRPLLATNGVRDADAPDSVRVLGDPPRGSVGIRHIPVSPLDSEWKFVEPGQRIKTDRLQVYSNAYGAAAGEYQLVVVQWTDRTRTVQTTNGTQEVPVAANQTVQRIDLELEEGYGTQTVDLSSSNNQTKEMTMWLERDGERINGATWQLRHSSIAAGQAVSVRTEADLWWYAIRTAVIPGIAGIILGLSLARTTLRVAGRGPGYGLASWSILGTIIFAVALGGLWFEIAEILSNFDVLMGLSLSIVAFGGGLRMHPPVDKIAFERQELQDAKALRREDRRKGDALTTDGGESESQDIIEIPADGYHDELFQDLPILPTVRGDNGTRYVPKKGIKPFLARIFADAARLDLSELKTRVKVATGAVSEKVYVSPESDPAVKHTPATLRSRVPVWHRVADRVEELETTEKVLYGALTLGTLALPAIGWYAGKAMLQTPVLGATLGTLLLTIEAYGAHNGVIKFDPAPRHFVTANASLTILQEEHADAKALEDFEEIAWEERSRTALEAREVESRRDRSVTQLLNEAALGMDLGVINDDSATKEEEKNADDLMGGESTTDPVETDGGADESE